MTDEERAANAAGNAPSIVLLALACFAILAWFFTDLYRLVHLNGPMQVFSWLPQDYFQNGHFRPFLVVKLTDLYEPAAELRLLLLALAAAFVCVYFAPVRFKRPLIVFWFLLTASILFGPRPILGLLVSHLFIYVVFHPRGPGARWIAGGAAMGSVLLIAVDDWGDPKGVVLTLVIAGLLGEVASRVHSRWLTPLLTRGRAGRWIRLAATHLPLVVLVSGTLAGVASGTPLVAPLALILLFFHYMRLLMYGIDVQDDLVPPDLPLWTYLSVFFSPATIDSWPLGVTIAQGYSYQTDRFLSRHKNELVLRGLALFGIGLAYMALGPFVILELIELAQRLGVQAYPSMPHLLYRHLGSHDAATSTVLVTSLLHHVQWIFTVGGVFHFNVGMWRLLGYDVDPYMRFPLLATNMVTLWSRLTLHWRDVLVRGFYYPAFLRLFGRPLWLRTGIAALVAAGLANWLWAHLTENLAVAGMSTATFVKVLWMWPYFFFLAGGIAIAQVWMTLRGRRRRPWTFDRWIVTDVLAAYATAQFYGMIHIFYFAPFMDTGAPGDAWLLFLRGFGLG